jgi:hypothetical protein
MSLLFDGTAADLVVIHFEIPVFPPKPFIGSMMMRLGCSARALLFASEWRFLNHSLRAFSDAASDAPAASASAEGGEVATRSQRQKKASARAAAQAAEATPAPPDFIGELQAVRVETSC